MEDPIFQDCLEEAKAQFGDQVQARCLSCHAPTVAFSGDAALQTKVSWEGVTCDFCHSISHVDLRSPENPYRLQIGAAKFGPLKDAFSRAHAVSFSKVHTDPVVCGGCHESRNSSGLLVLSTYSEWQESPYGSDRASCLNCHMSPVKGRLVDPRVQGSPQSPINLHQMPGGHSLDQLNKALAGRVVTQREGDKLHVKVFVRNRGAGHFVPSGSPLRKLTIAVDVYPQTGPRLREERSYQRSVADEKGTLLADEPSVWIRGARVVSDNRLRPNEERTEVFVFDLPRTQMARVQARFSYHYSPLESQDTGKQVFLILPAIAEPESPAAAARHSR